MVFELFGCVKKLEGQLFAISVALDGRLHTLCERIRGRIDGVHHDEA